MEIILFKKKLYEHPTYTPSPSPLLEGYQSAKTVIVEHLDQLTLEQSTQLLPSQWNKTFGLWEVRRLNLKQALESWFCGKKFRRENTHTVRSAV